MSRSLNCTLYPEECERERSMIPLISALLALLSCIGSVSIIFSVIWFRLYPRLRNRMIVYLFMCDFIHSIGSMISIGWVSDAPNGTEFICGVQGFLFNYANVTAALWNVNMALFMTVCILSTSMEGMTNLPGKKYEVFSLLIWIFGFLMPVIGLSSERDNQQYFDVVSSGIYCWISHYYPTERLTLHHMWMFFALGSMIILTTINLVYLCYNAGSFGEEIDKRIGKLITTLSGYPIIYAIIYMPIAVQRVLSAGGIEPSIELLWFAGVLTNLNGSLSDKMGSRTSGNYKKRKKSKTINIFRNSFLFILIRIPFSIQ
eukprot:TRINITY_DN4105_c0_g1_i1.p1 TRINITY_DN4105_c0_g1~~TRINITY_DN4105_c0_g1_i1.p1  ORF type:complete len:335 (+),score=42.30 TRINITY_DN4105_c0_g1_i1:60-1007(+)